MTAAALSYRHPRVRTSFAAPPPRAIAITIERYQRDFENRSGPLWDWFRSRVPAVFDGEGRPGDRRRALRTDGADTLVCAIVTLLRSMDLQRGFLGRPPAEGEQIWHRRSVLELFGFAFGKPVRGALSVRRMARCLRALRDLGILVSHQVRTRGSEGFQSKAAVRIVTDRLFQLAGTIGQLAKERREAHQRAERARSAAQASRRIETVRMDRSGDPARPIEQTAHRPSAGAPPRAGPPQQLRDLVGRIKSSLRRA